VSTAGLRVPIRVKPGSSRTRVGGEWGADPPRLVVAVQARAVDGKANKAVVEALAAELGVSRRLVRIVAGLKNRSKLVEIAEPDAATRTLIAELQKS
jgi:uncharacterized protein (TIGR00251 family)